MADDVILNKAATIERCVRRAREEFEWAGGGFATDRTRQDAAILNIQRACEAAIDLGTHIIRTERFELPQSARGVFDVLQASGVIDEKHLEDLLAFTSIALRRA